MTTKQNASTTEWHTERASQSVKSAHEDAPIRYVIGASKSGSEVLREQTLVPQGRTSEWEETHGTNGRAIELAMIQMIKLAAEQKAEIVRLHEKDLRNTEKWTPIQAQLGDRAYKIGSQEREIATLKEEIATLKKEIADAAQNAAIETIVERDLRNTGKWDPIQATLAIRAYKIESQEREIATLKEEIAATETDKIRSLKVEIARLTEETYTLDDAPCPELAPTQAELAAARSELRDVYTELRAARIEIQKITARAEVGTLKSEINIINADLARKTSQRDAARKEIAEKKATIGRCTDAITDTTFRLIMANKEIDRLGGEAQ